MRSGHTRLETPSSIPNLEAKQSRATSVLGWETSWERAVLLFALVFALAFQFSLSFVFPLHFCSAPSICLPLPCPYAFLHLITPSTTYASRLLSLLLICKTPLMRCTPFLPLLQPLYPTHSLPFLAFFLPKSFYCISFRVVINLLSSVFVR